jgi:hypothetical protein
MAATNRRDLARPGIVRGGELVMQVIAVDWSGR